MKLGIYILIVIGFVQNCYGQLTGTITSNKGEKLSYVTIYSKTATQGTLSNEDGYFQLDIKSGKHEIIVEHLGYEEYTKTIDLNNQNTLNIQLKEREYLLDELTITDTQDAAYDIIKKAIKQREKHYKSRTKYSVDVYSKGVAKVLDAPKSVLGTDVGNMEGMLDASRQGIVYFAESESSYYFHQPDLEKEIVKSSVVAEGDDALNINRFLDVEYDIYKPTFEFNKTILNPLANSALSWYNYEFIDMDIERDGTEIYRIKVSPKNNSRALMQGDLYIENKAYKVTQLDLSVPGKSVGQSFINNINFKQIYHTSDDTYALPISQVTSLDVGMFGFKIKAAFTFVYNNYDFGNSNLERNFFDSEVYRFDEDAVVTDTTYWNKNRPIPLTQEEQLNYIKKDSLKKIWSNKSYLDSLDKANNKFKWLNLLTGYSNENSYRNSTWSVSSPLKRSFFHPVTGLSMGMGANFTKRFGNKERKRIDLFGGIDYGFADKNVRWNFGTNLVTNRKHKEAFMLRVNNEYKQFGFIDKTPYLLGIYRALAFKEHLIKLYKSQNVKLGYQREIANGLHLQLLTSYDRRSRLKNNTNYAFMKGTDAYESNRPLSSMGSDFFPDHDMWSTRLKFNYVPFQKYISYNGDKINLANDWPTFNITYDLGYGSNERSFHKIRLGMTKEEINFNLWGKSFLRIEAGTFISKNKLEFIDQFHFRASSIYIDQYKQRFKRMPFYTYSTDKRYIMNIYEHNFNGFILNSIPVVKKLGWNLVLGANSLIRADESNYFESTIGIDNIQVMGLDLLRVDYVLSFEDGKYKNSGVTAGVYIEF